MVNEGLFHKGKLLRYETPANIKKQTGASATEQAFILVINGCENGKGAK
jgi:hypothetical protein